MSNADNLTSFPSEKNFEARLQNLEREILFIARRNNLKDREKAWEISHTRTALVVIFTYAIMYFTFWKLGADRPDIQAIIPTLGFFLSRLSLAMVRKFWERPEGER